LADKKHLTMDALKAGLKTIHQSPKDEGVLEMIVRRPAVDQREVLEAGELSLREGLVGDNWRPRGTSLTSDGTAHPDRQLSLMNSRVSALLAQDRARWPLAGDQLYIDLDFSWENLPPGTRLVIGSAVVEITAEPHFGGNTFLERFDLDATKFVNSTLGQELQLRGVHAKVVEPGLIRTGDVVKRQAHI